MTSLNIFIKHPVMELKITLYFKIRQSKLLIIYSFILRYYWERREPVDPSSAQRMYVESLEMRF